MSNSGTLASNRQNTENPKYNSISLLMSQYFISERTVQETLTQRKSPGRATCRVELLGALTIAPPPI
jgi:hypothetical protein